jgi:ABC-type sugar transport system permease subunit
MTNSPFQQRGRRQRSHVSLAPYLFIAPFFILFFTFTAYPLASSIWLSLHDTIGLRSRVFVGAGNYVDLLRDELWWKALTNTVYFTLGTLFLQLPLALALAIALNSKALRLRTFFRFAFFSPVLVAGVFIAIIFGLVFNNEYGLLNYLLRSLGLEQPLLHGLQRFGWLKDATDLRWLQREELVMPALILTGVWRWTGFNMIYFLAGLQSIREELYEAAVLDGANKWNSFVHITLPGLRPIILFVLIVSLSGSLQIFEIPYILLSSGTGPNNSGLTVVMYLYQRGFQYSQLGYAAAIGWALFVIIFAFSVAQMKFLGRTEEA